MSNSYAYVKTFRRNIKGALIEAFGGECVICGYNKCQSALEFHHINSTDKEFNLSSWSKLSTKRIAIEASKCVMLCCRCHRELHENELSIEDKPYFSLSVFESTLESYKSDLCICGNPKSIRNDYCSDRCKCEHNGTIYFDANIAYDEFVHHNMSVDDISIKYDVHINNVHSKLRYKGIQVVNSNSNHVDVNRPDKDELQVLVNTYSLEYIGRVYNVTGNAVRKWCKKFEINTTRPIEFTRDEILYDMSNKLTKKDIYSKYGIGKDRFNTLCKYHNITYIIT